MAKIADTYAARGGEPLFICDFSPPRGASHDNLRSALALDADWLSIPYNPGKSVYANSAMAAHSLSTSAGKDVVFTIATRDTNILAAQSLLLGAALLGLENVVVVRGDDFTASQLHATKAVHDRTPTALIRSIAAMNAGIDFRGRALSAPTSFCIGATIDMARGVEAEVALTRRKLEAGAHFFITQPTFTPGSPAALPGTLPDDIRRGTRDASLLWRANTSGGRQVIRRSAAMGQPRPARRTFRQRHRSTGTRRILRRRPEVNLPAAAHTSGRRARLRHRPRNAPTLQFALSLTLGSW